MKIALCFIISYEHVVVKEQIWKEWIEPNRDIINIYFHYKDASLIKSPWIKKHVIPENNVVNTTYYHMIPAYLSLLSYALNADQNNKWFCLLTDSCVPIISPLKFREMFFKYSDYSIFNWKPCWWNVNYHKRANLYLLNNKLHLGNDPWFVLKKEDVLRCFTFSVIKKDMYNTICNGGLANESLFAIILHTFNQLINVKKSPSHVTDWDRMSSATSPHIFKEGNKKDIDFIENFLKHNKYAMFLRKIHKDFPDEILNDFIWKEDHDEDIREKRVARIVRLERIFLWKKWIWGHYGFSRGVKFWSCYVIIPVVAIAATALWIIFM